MTKNKLLNLKFQILLSAFFTPVILLIGVLFILGAYPFGDVTFLRVDMNQQYSAFLTYLRSIVFGDNDLFYSFSMNSGGNFYFLFTYYLANPINWVMALVSPEKIPYALSWLILLRFGMAGVTSALYFEKIAPRSFGWKTLLFSTSYALMTYTIVNAENYFFIDGVIMLPVILIGVENIIEGRSFMSYVIPLAFMLMIHFYIGYMICIFTAIYFFFKWVLAAEYRKDHRALWSFVFGSILAGLLAAVILFPALAGLSNIPKDTTINWEEIHFNFNFFDLLSKNLLGAYTLFEYQYGLPGIYCGALITINCILFFKTQTIRKIEKIMTGLILLFLWLSFFITELNRVWHGFAEPVWWPYRYSFLFSFWMIRMAYLSYISNKKISILRVVIAMLTGSALLFFPIFSSFDFISYKFIVSEAIFFSAILFLQFGNGYRSQERKRSPIYSVLIISIVMINLFWHIWTILSQNLSESVSGKDYAFHVKAQNELIEKIYPDKGRIARIENIHLRDSNDPMRLNYAGLSHYSSTVNYKKNLTPLKIFGIPQLHYWSKVTDGVPMGTLSLFGIQTIFGYDNDSNSIRSIPTALPMSFLVPKRIIRHVNYGKIPYENLNQIYKNLVEKDFGSIYAPIEVNSVIEDNAITWEIETKDTYPIYMFAHKYDVTPNIIERENHTFPIEVLHETSYLVSPEKNKKFLENEFIRINTSLDGFITNPEDRVFYTENLTILAQYAKAIQRRGVDLKKISSSHLSGIYSSEDENDYLFFSILYDDGWQAFVDGKEQLIIPALEHFMMIQTEPGTHIVELKYTPPGFRTGSILSLIGLAVLVFCGWKDFNRRKSLTS